MICAYDRVYLDKARTALARMLDFAVQDLKYNIKDFFDQFIQSSVGTRFEKGDPSIIAGKSGVELAYMVLEEKGEERERIKPSYLTERSEEYWVGNVLAYYQWKTSLTFSEIAKYISISTVVGLYTPYHEMDIRQFVDKMNELYKRQKPDTNLKLLRKTAGLSQKELSDQANVSFRTIQQYEQRQKNINKAAFESIVSLSRVLLCDPERLLELI